MSAHKIPALPNWEGVMSEVELDLMLDALRMVMAAEQQARRFALQRTAENRLANHSVPRRLVRQLTAQAALDGGRALSRDFDSVP